jgi:hypothetical protein
MEAPIIAGDTHQIYVTDHVTTVRPTRPGKGSTPAPAAEICTGL